MSESTLEHFEAEVRQFLAARVPPRNADAATSGGGTQSEADELAAARRWQAERFDAGFGWITGPTEYGGRGLTPAHERLYRRVQAEYQAPRTAMLNFGLAIIGPCVERHGSQAGREKYLRQLFRGDLVACQLYSEPTAGSDLAAAQTRAVRDGDDWVLNGQKVWTSNGHNSDVGQCVCRTDVNVPKHQGMTIFMVDMHAPGVEVRPLVDATGEAHFDEVFLTDVRVSDSDRLGEVNDGWRTLNTSLMSERAYVGGSNEAGAGALSPDILVEALSQADVLDDPIVRDGLADLIVRFRVAGYLTKHAAQRAERDGAPGPAMSVAKLTYSDNQERLVNFAASALGPLITADTGLDLAWPWATHLIGGRAKRISGGTDEIQRTIIGERVLGLPRDPSIDNSIPFKDIPRSTRRDR